MWRCPTTVKVMSNSHGKAPNSSFSEWWPKLIAIQVVCLTLQAQAETSLEPEESRQKQASWRPPAPLVWSFASKRCKSGLQLSQKWHTVLPVESQQRNSQASLPDESTFHGRTVWSSPNIHFQTQSDYAFFCTLSDFCSHCMIFFQVLRTPLVLFVQLSSSMTSPSQAFAFQFRKETSCHKQKYMEVSWANKVPPNHPSHVSIWGFPQKYGGYPQFSSIFHGIFPNKNHPATLGVSQPLMDPPTTSLQWFGAQATSLQV